MQAVIARMFRTLVFAWLLIGSLGAHASECAPEATSPLATHYKHSGQTSWNGARCIRIALKRNKPIQLYLMAGKLETFVTEAPLREVGLVLSTNARLMLSNAEFPLVQTAIRNALPETERAKLKQLFDSEAVRRGVRTAPLGASLFLRAAEPFAIRLPLQSTIGQSTQHMCFLATDMPEGGTAQAPAWQVFNMPQLIGLGVERCLTAMATADEITAVALPLIGAASAGHQQPFPRLCRMYNSLIGVLDGLARHMTTVEQSKISEAAVVIWQADIARLNQASASAEREFPQIFEQVAAALEKGARPNDLLLASCDPASRERLLKPLK